MPSDRPAAQITKLKRQLRDVQADLKRARAELARRPPLPSPEDLTPDEIRHLHAQFAPATGETCPTCGRIHAGPCQSCGGLHARACPRVRSVAYQPQGDKVLIREVTFWPDGKWPTDGILFPDELPELPEP